MAESSFKATDRTARIWLFLVSFLGVEISGAARGTVPNERLTEFTEFWPYLAIEWRCSRLQAHEGHRGGALWLKDLIRKGVGKQCLQSFSAAY
jgi:hypothetical protein